MLEDIYSAICICLSVDIKRARKSREMRGGISDTAAQATEKDVIWLMWSGVEPARYRDSAPQMRRKPGGKSWHCL